MRIYDIDKKCYVDIVKYDDPTTKAEQLADSLYCYQHNIFKVVYDQSQQALKSYIATLDNALLHEEKMQWLFFTSGTTGTPTGIYKTKQNSYEQAQALIKTLKGIKFDRVVTTVPFVHIYGIDIGGVVPFELDIDVWVKENFLPEELVLEAQKEHTLIVTTPLYIKALNRIKKDIKFENTLFLTSTAPLPTEEAKTFKEHYGASVVQMFASTETGLISYKTDDEIILNAYDIVQVSENNDRLCVTSPLVTKKIIDNGFKEDVVLPFQTEDIVEIINEKQFNLLGRSSNLAKIAGKRISTQQIESLIETLDDIEAVLIRIRRDDKALKDEILDIYVESKITLDGKTVRNLLRENFGSIHIPFKIHNNKKILRSSVGKKIGLES